MGIELVVIDHHEPRGPSPEAMEEYHIPTAEDREAFFGIVSDCLEQPFDLVFADQDPDGSLAAAIYGLSAERRPDITCMRGDFDSAALKTLESEGVKRVLCLDWYGVYTSDLSAAERVTVLNPLFSGLPSTLCTTHIVYEAVRQSIGSASADTALALAAIGIASDYCTESALGLFKEIAYGYPEYFKDVLQLLRKGELDKYTVFGTRFRELSEMVWAPYILNGSEGSEKMVNAILDNGTFGIGGMLRGSRNPAVVYMRGEWEKFQELIEAEWVYFDATAEIEPPFIVYEPRETRYAGIVQKFSSMVADKYEDSIVMARVPVEGGTKYSFRRRRFDIDLGGILKEMGVGGGHPEAAGCIVPDAGEFEGEFKKRVRQHALERFLGENKR